MATISIRGLLVSVEDLGESAARVMTMLKRFYLATKKDRIEEAKPLLDALGAEGWERTFAWSEDDSKGTPEFARLACAELAGVRAADVLVVLLPGGYGTHVEIGAALALDKAVVIHSRDRQTLETPYPCVFHYHPSVTLMVSVNLDIDAVMRQMRLALGHGVREQECP
jgi:nucleoside 2-deoxyribosyltransferase